MSPVKDGFIVKGVYRHIPIKGKYFKRLNGFMTHRDGQVCCVSRADKCWLPWGISFVPRFDRDQAVVFECVDEAIAALACVQDSQQGFVDLVVERVGGYYGS